MYNKDTDFIFPPRVIPALRDLRGPEWVQLVDSCSKAAPMSPEILGFVLMMVELNGCQGCNADSFRAMRGCTACSVQTVERLNETDETLVAQHQDAVKQVQKYLNRK